jgi:transposase
VTSAERYTSVLNNPAEFLRIVEEKDQEIDKLWNLVRQLKKEIYGPKSERVKPTANPDQLTLFSFDEVVAPPVEEESVAIEEHTRAIRRGRKPLPDTLPREEVFHKPEVTECTHCHAELVQIGEERSQELEKVPAHLKIIEHIRPKMACSACKEHGVKVEPLPVSVLPIEGARPGAGLLADIIVSKYVDCIPLHKQEELFRRQGIELRRQRMCDWVRAVVEIVTPLYDALQREILKSPYVQADETTLKVQDGATPGKCHTGYLWGIHGPPDLIWFHYADTRAGKVPEELFKGYQGVVQTDAYAGYNPVFLPSEVRRLACLAHIRRKFIDVQDTAGSECNAILRLISDIYRKERSGNTPEQLLAIRAAVTGPLLEKLFTYLKELRNKILPKAPIQSAITYTLNQETEMLRVLESGVYHLDNNSIERQMKYIAMGRKNYYFAGSHEGAHRAAVLYSLLGSCRLNKVNPWQWLSDVLRRMHSQPASKANELLPHRWRPVTG